jgi:hypothetical protein
MFHVSIGKIPQDAARVGIESKRGLELVTACSLLPYAGLAIMRGAHVEARLVLYEGPDRTVTEPSSQIHG